MSESLSSRRALSLVALGAVTISSAPVLVKLLAGEGMGPTPIAMWRVLIAGSCLLVFARLRWGTATPPAGVRGVAIIAGLVVAGDLYIWHRSIVYVGAGMATILGNTQVFWTALLGRLLYKEPLTKRLAAAAVVAFVGVVLLAGAGSQVEMTGTYALGFAFGLGTGIAYAGYIISIRHAGMRWQAVVDARAPGGVDIGALGRASIVLGWATLGASIVLVGLSAAEGAAVLPTSATQVLLVIALALGVQVLGWLVISFALPHVRAARAALLLLIQPALAAVWGYLLFSEELSPLQVTGAALTLLGIYLGRHSD